MPRVIFSERHVAKTHARQRVVYEAGQEYLVNKTIAEEAIAAGKAVPKEAQEGDPAETETTTAQTSKAKRTK